MATDNCWGGDYIYVQANKVQQLSYMLTEYKNKMLLDKLQSNYMVWQS